MDGDTKAFVFVITLISTAVVSLILCITYYNVTELRLQSENEQMAIEAGMIQVPTTFTKGVHWELPAK